MTFGRRGKREKMGSRLRGNKGEGTGMTEGRAVRESPYGEKDGGVRNRGRGWIPASAGMTEKEIGEEGL